MLPVVFQTPLEIVDGENGTKSKRMFIAFMQPEGAKDAYGSVVDPSGETRMVTPMHETSDYGGSPVRVTVIDTEATRKANIPDIGSEAVMTRVVTVMTGVDAAGKHLIGICKTRNGEAFRCPVEYLKLKE